MNNLKSYIIIISILLGITTINGCGKASSNTPTLPETEKTASEYIDIEKTDELRLYSQSHESLYFTVNNSFYNSVTNFINSESYNFSYSDYYGLDEAIKLYQNSSSQKSIESNLLDPNDKLDKAKLLASIEVNNKNSTANGKNALNSFYTETSAQDKAKICNLIVDVINSTCDKAQRQRLANSLSSMTLFTRTGSASNAYVTNHLTFVYNPSMSKMYADTQSITGNDDKESIMNSVIVHEIMHLIQHENDDLIDENGIEVGMCRTYNLDNSDKKIPVDCLWNSWILEGSAELGMSDYLGIDTHTYSKKISYIRSYNFSRFNKLLNKDTLIEKIAFCDTLEQVYEELNLSSLQEQYDFLKFMYSVEILQTDPTDFWDNYSKITNTTPTDEEKLAIRLSIRSEVVKYLSTYFYSNLASAIQDRKITDLNTLFYLMRLWEIDCYTHLEYTKTSSLDSAKSFILWQDKIQTHLFQILANASGLSFENIQEQYQAYRLQTQLSGSTLDNCSFNYFETFTREYLLELKSNYTTGNFIKNKDMAKFLTGTE